MLVQSLARAGPARGSVRICECQHMMALLHHAGLNLEKVEIVLMQQTSGPYSSCACSSTSSNGATGPR